MSIRVMSQIWDTGPDDREELLVLLALADFADDAGRCYPSMAAIAAKARLSERGAQKIVRRLQEAGWLAIKTGGGRGGANVYTIKNPEHETPNEKRGIAFPPERGSNKPRTGVHKTPNTGSPEPSGTIKEPSKSKARKRADDGAVRILSEVVPVEVAQDFADHRRHKRATLTEQAAKLVAEKLRQCRNPVAAVNEAIANGWTGVFPREQAQPTPQAPSFDFEAAMDKAFGNAR